MDMNGEAAAGRGSSSLPHPVVILPGLLCDTRMFATQVAALGAQVVDGFYGDADTIGRMADYAIERLPGRCALLGHSMGARVALEVWRKAPERIERLALADTGVHPVKAGEREARMKLRDLGERYGADALVDAWLPPMLGPEARDDDCLATLHAMCVNAGVATYARQIAALLSRPDALAVLPTITCPTMVIVGSEDRWSPVAQHEAIATAIPGSRLRVVPGAGHMTPAEAPDAFNDLLREWLGQESDSGRPMIEERADP